MPFKTFKHKQKNVKLNPKFYKQPVQKCYNCNETSYL